MPAVANVDNIILADDARSRLADVCRRYGIHWLAVFGSIVRGDARADSDVDLLVEWDPEVRMTYIRLEELAGELSGFFGGRYVDVGRPRQLHWFIRDRVMAEAKVLYAR